MSPLIQFDLDSIKNYKYIAGIDEVGRGSFAGPITAAMVIFSEEKIRKYTDLLNEVRDSKKLTHQKRLTLSDKIKKVADFYCIKSIKVAYINKHGIGVANKKVIELCLDELLSNFENSCILIDGNIEFNYKNLNTTSLIKGDSSSLAIASASILAKTYRDLFMIGISSKYLNYNFSKNKGYGTQDHRNAIKNFGLTDQHRTNWKII